MKKNWLFEHETLLMVSFIKKTLLSWQMQKTIGVKWWSSFYNYLEEESGHNINWLISDYHLCVEALMDNSMQTCTLDINISDTSDCIINTNSLITQHTHPYLWYILAFCMAALVQSTLGPRVQKPCLSGGLTCIRATSKSIIFRWKSSGISLKKMGVKSARPSFTAFPTIGPNEQGIASKNSYDSLQIKFYSLKKSLRNMMMSFIQYKNANRKIACQLIVTTYCLKAQPSATMYSSWPGFGKG